MENFAGPYKVLDYSMELCAPVGSHALLPFGCMAPEFLLRPPTLESRLERSRVSRAARRQQSASQRHPAAVSQCYRKHGSATYGTTESHDVLEGSGSSLRATKLATVLGTSLPKSPMTTLPACKTAADSAHGDSAVKDGSMTLFSELKLSVLCDSEPDASTCWFPSHGEVKVDLVGDFWVCMSTAGSSIRVGQRPSVMLCGGHNDFIECTTWSTRMPAYGSQHRNRSSVSEHSSHGRLQLPASR